MQQATQLPEIKLIGITARTNNFHEMDPATAMIGRTIQSYFQNGLSEKIAHRRKPGTTYCCYTDYESDLHGDYTYFIGEEVLSFDDQPDGFSTLIIPSQSYLIFSSGPGPMPAVCMDMWEKIWAMEKQPDVLGGTRGYRTDFELYDERAQDPNNTVLDIYIGIHETQSPGLL